MRKILIVEDNDKLSRLYAKALTKAGYDVFQVRTIEHALLCLPRIEPGIIVLDLNMPDGDGRVIINALQEENRYSDTRVIVVSGRAEMEQTVKDLGVQEFLFKPVEIDTLRQTVARVNDSAQMR